MGVTGTLSPLLMPLSLPTSWRHSSVRPWISFLIFTSLLSWSHPFIPRVLRYHPSAVDPNIHTCSPSSPVESRPKHPLGCPRDNSALACPKQGSILLPTKSLFLGPMGTIWMNSISQNWRNNFWILYNSSDYKSKMLIIENLENIEKHEKKK